MVLYPFKKENRQQISSLWIALAGVIILVTENLYTVKIGTFTFHFAIIGGILIFAGLLYFIDASL